MVQFQFLIPTLQPEMFVLVLVVILQENLHGKGQYTGANKVLAMQRCLAACDKDGWLTHLPPGFSA